MTTLSVIFLVIAGGLFVSMALAVVFPHIERHDRWAASAFVLAAIGTLSRAWELAR